MKSCASFCFLRRFSLILSTILWMWGSVFVYVCVFRREAYFSCARPKHERSVSWCISGLRILITVFVFRGILSFHSAQVCVYTFSRLLLIVPSLNEAFCNHSFRPLLFPRASSWWAINRARSSASIAYSRLWSLPKSSKTGTAIGTLIESYYTDFGCFYLYLLAM